jgi:hypothetical protein
MRCGPAPGRSRALVPPCLSSRALFLVQFRIAYIFKFVTSNIITSTSTERKYTITHKTKPRPKPIPKSQSFDSGQPQHLVATHRLIGARTPSPEQNQKGSQPTPIGQHLIVPQMFGVHRVLTPQVHQQPVRCKLDSRLTQRGSTGRSSSNPRQVGSTHPCGSSIHCQRGRMHGHCCLCQKSCPRPSRSSWLPC